MQPRDLPVSGANLEDLRLLRECSRACREATRLSQRSRGVLGWSALDLMRGFASRRAIALEFEIVGETDAPVSIHNYGTKFAYRQAVLRKWLIMELRTSVSWPQGSSPARAPLEPRCRNGV
jgi:hypothetical protein